MARTIGYARTSTTEQVAGLEAQQRDLLAAGCTTLFSEQVSSVADSRAELIKALAGLEGGDVLIVTKPDRLARSTIDLLRIVEDLTKREVGLIILSMGGERLDTRNPTSKLMLTILAGVAQWEREIMKERQKEGIAKAKADGRYAAIVRKTMPKETIDSVHRMELEKISPEQIMRDIGISRSTFFRAKRAWKSNGNSQNLQIQDACAA